MACRLYVPRAATALLADAPALLAAQSGDADLAFQVPTQALGTLRSTPGLRVPESMSDNQYFLCLDERTAPTADDVVVRRAVSLGVDRKELVEKVLGGRWTSRLMSTTRSTRGG